MMATRGKMVSGSAVPIAASTLPTAPSESPNPSPTHSTPFVKTSAPARMMGRATTSATTSTVGKSRVHRRSPPAVGDAPAPRPYDACVDAGAFLTKRVDEFDASDSLAHVQRLPAREPSPQPFPQDLPQL